MALDINVLEQLLESVAKELLGRVKSGEADSQDIANALRMLRDNSVVVTVKDNSAIDALNEKLAKRRIRKPSIKDVEVTKEMSRDVK